jgi:hypothetical protein
MQQRGIPAGFILGVFLSCYMVLFGCSSVNATLLQAIDKNAQEICRDYERVLTAPNNPIFEGFTKEERQMHIESRLRSCEEMLATIQRGLKNE